MAVRSSRRRTDTASWSWRRTPAGPQTWDLIAQRAFGPDVAHLDRVLDAVVDRVDVDTDRMAVGGVSDGASYALSIGLTNGDVFGTVIASARLPRRP